MIQSFLTDPPRFAEAFGAQRVKRSTWDHEFNLRRLGVSLGIKYKNKNSSLEGVMAEVKIENIQNIVPNYPQPKKMQIIMDADNFEKIDDDLFKIDIKYVVDDGKSNNLFVSRKKVGDKWTTVIEHKGMIGKKEANLKINLSSDRETFLTFTFTSNDLGNFKFDGKVKNINEATADIILSGQLYKVSGTWIEGKELKLSVKNPESNHLMHIFIKKEANKFQFTVKDSRKNDLMRIFIKNEEKDDTGMYKIDIGTDEIDVGIDRVKIKIVQDSVVSKSSFDMSLMANNKTLGDLKSMVKVGDIGKALIFEGKFIEYRDTLASRESKVAFMWNFSDQKNITSKLEILPCPDFGIKDLVMIATGNFQVTDTNGSDISFHSALNIIIMRNKEEMIKYNYTIGLNEIGTTDIQLDFKHQLKLSSNSMIYPIICSYGCWNDLEYKASHRTDKINIFKKIENSVLKIDDKDVFNMHYNTKNNPMELIIKAPTVLPKFLSSGRSSIEFKADYKPGKKHLKKLSISSNTNLFSSIIIERLSQNHITLLATFPDGKVLTTTFKSMFLTKKQNNINITLKGADERNLVVANFDFDLNRTRAPDPKVDTQESDKRSGDFNTGHNGITIRNLEKLAEAMLKPRKYYYDLVLNINVKGNIMRFGDYKVIRQITAKSERKTGHPENTIFKTILKLWKSIVLLEFSSMGESTFENAPWPNPIKTDIEIYFDPAFKKYNVKIMKNAGGVDWGMTLSPNGEVQIYPSVTHLADLAFIGASEEDQ